MSIPYIETDNKIKIAPFKTPNIKPYGAFANTTAIGTYPIKQTVNIHGETQRFLWPSSEHAYHAQKIIFLKTQLNAFSPVQHTLNRILADIQNTSEQYSPRKHYDRLVEDYLPLLRKNGLRVAGKSAFDRLCEADYHPLHNPNGYRRTIDFMTDVIQLKLEQHPKLAHLAMECAKEGVLPVEVSQYDSNWASGPNGDGDNLLGNIIYKEGVRLLKKKGGKPAFKNPDNKYIALRKSQDISYNNLVRHLDPLESPAWTLPSLKGSSTYSPYSQSQKAYFYSRGGNQRLEIKNGKIICCEYRDNSQSKWQKAKNNNRFKNLIDAFERQQNKSIIPPQRKISSPNRPRKTAYAGSPTRGTRNQDSKQAIMALKQYYIHATSGSGRTFFVNAATVANHAGLKNQYKNLRGDALKTKILLNFEKEINQCTSCDDLDLLKSHFKAEYEVLAKVQGLGLISRISGRTSSQDALDQLIERRKREINEDEQNIQPTFKSC